MMIHQTGDHCLQKKIKDGISASGEQFYTSDAVCLVDPLWKKFTYVVSGGYIYISPVIWRAESL